MTAALVATAQALVSVGKGLLAMDESNPTCDKRFAAAGIPQTVETRRAYRELIVTTPGLGECISGAILYDETIRQSDRHGDLLIDRLTGAGIIPGIKVDLGAKVLAFHPGEMVTEGLDGPRARLSEYAGMGARFAKWRAVIGLAGEQPSRACISANAQALARYAALCQEAGLVPIVEPEALMTGSHAMTRCETVTGEVLASVFDALRSQSVVLEAMILKPNMVLPGLACSRQDPVEVVAAETVRCLRRTVPAAVAGVAFLSGGHCYRDGCPDGESAGDVSERADRLLARLCRLPGNVALFSHGQFGCSLAARWIGLPVLQGEHLQLGTASLSILGLKPDHPGLRVIMHWNMASPDFPEQFEA